MVDRKHIHPPLDCWGLPLSSEFTHQSSTYPDLRNGCFCITINFVTMVTKFPWQNGYCDN